MGRHEATEIPIIEPTQDRPIRGFEWRTVTIEVDQYKSLPKDTGDRLEWVILYLKTLDLGHVRSIL
jgi:hypothetical protein